MSLTFTLNGQSVAIGPAPPQATLLDFLRARGLTGAKEGCAEGECGACAVAIVQDEGGRGAYRAVNSCLMFLPMAAGQEIYTVEALAERGRLSDAQAAMAAAGGSQCGYCTPGFVVSLFAEQYRRERASSCDPLALAGNLCRCTGYRPIRDAARSLGPPRAGALRDRLDRPAPRLGDITRVTGTVAFSRPASVDRCLAVLAGDPEATLVAGASDLAVDANIKGKRFRHLVSVEAIDELLEYSETPDAVRIGAALPLAEIGRRWRLAPPAVAEWLALFASPPIRNRATLGGNLATASPIGDAAPLLLAFDAAVHVAGPGGRRRVPLASFFVGYRKTALRPGELLTTIEIPKPLPAALQFYKVSKRRLDDISTVAAAMALDVDPTGRVARARVAFGGVAATPVRVTRAEAALEGQALDAQAVNRVCGIFDETLHPIDDFRGSKAYRLAVSKRLVEKFAWELGTR
jgi:xanthine dehydrogenase small subunit